MRSVDSSTARWTLAGGLIFALSLAVVLLRPPLQSAGGASVVRGGSASATAPPFHESGANLSMNSSFEIESNVKGVADQWVKTDQNGQYSLDDRAKYGKRSQRITKKGEPDPQKAYSSVQQAINVTGGHTYQFAVDYAYEFDSAPDASQSVGVVIFSLDKSGRFIDDGTIIDWGWPTAGDWTRKTVTFKTPAGAAKVVIQLRLTVNGTVWFDGADLEDVGS